MLAPHEIVPAIQSLADLYMRPATDVKTASENAQVAQVLRNKIASAIVKLADERADEEGLRQVLDALRYQVHNSAVLSLLGVDLSDMEKRVLRKIQLISDMPRLAKVLAVVQDSEGAPYLDRFFEGTEHAQASRDEKIKLAIAFLRKSEKTTEFVKSVFGLVKKARSRGGFVGSDTIGGIPTAEYVTDIIMVSVIGIDTDEDELLSDLKIRKVGNNTLYGKILRKALKRRQKVLALDPADMGKGRFSWLARAHGALGDLSFLSAKVVDEIKRKLAEDRSAQIGDEETLDTLMESVSEAFSSVVEELSEKEDKNDTAESRENFSVVKKAYENAPDDNEAAEDFAKAVFGRVRTSRIAISDVRWLLENIDKLSDETALQNKARSVIYDVLFNRGALLDHELSYLDNAFDPKDVNKEKRTILRPLLKAFDDLPSARKHFDYREMANGLSDIITQLYALKDKTTSLKQELYTKKEIALYSAYLTAMSRDRVSLVLQKIEDMTRLAEAAADTETISYLEDLKADFEPLSEHLQVLRGKRVFMPSTHQTSGGGAYFRGAHPLNSYSISDYKGLSNADVGAQLGGQATIDVSATALDLRIATQVTRALRGVQGFSEGVAVVEAKKADLDGLLEGLNLMATADPTNIEIGVERIDEFIALNIADGNLEAELKKLMLLKKGKPITDQLSKVKKALQPLLDSLKSEYRSLYERNMDKAISSVYQEVLEQETTPRQRLGDEDYVYRIQRDRTLENISRDTSWDEFELAQRESLKGDKTGVQKVMEAVEARVNDAKMFKEALGEIGIDPKKATANDARKLLTEVRKRLSSKSATELTEKAFRMSEAEVLKAQTDSLMSLSESELLKGTGFVPELATLLRQGHVQKADRVSARKKKELNDAFEQMKRDIASLGSKDEVTQQESLSSLSRSPFIRGTDLVGDLNEKAEEGDRAGAQKLLSERVKEVESGIKEVLSALESFREATILHNIATFEDRISRAEREAASAQIAEIEARREGKLKALSAKKDRTPEEEDEFTQMQAGIDEDSRSINRLGGGALRDRINAKIKTQRLERELSARARYAPVVESKEESIRASAKKMVEQAVGAFVSSEVMDNPFAETTQENVLLPNREMTAGILERTRALKKLSALRDRFASEFKNAFTGAVDRVTQEQVASLTGLIKSKPYLFPSIDPARDGGLSVAYLTLPYVADSGMTNVDGTLYQHKTQNVFSDLNYAVNIRSFTRTLYAAASLPLLQESGRDTIIPEAGGDQKEFYENFFANDVGNNILRLYKSFRKEGDEYLETASEFASEHSAQATTIILVALGQTSDLSSGLTNPSALFTAVQKDQNAIFGNTNALAVKATSNYKGLLSDLALHITLNTLLDNMSITEKEVVDAGFNPDDVLEVASIFGARSGDQFSREIKDIIKSR